MAKKYFLFSFLLFVLFFSRKTILNEAKNLYYLQFSETSNTMGRILAIEENASIGGGLSYKYRTLYQAAGKSYEKDFFSSPNALDVSVGESVHVIYCSVNPAFSYLKVLGFNWRNIVIFTALIFGLLYLFIVIGQNFFRSVWGHN